MSVSFPGFPWTVSEAGTLYSSERWSSPIRPEPSPPLQTGPPPDYLAGNTLAAPPAGRSVLRSLRYAVQAPLEGMVSSCSHPPPNRVPGAGPHPDPARTGTEPGSADFPARSWSAVRKKTRPQTADWHPESGSPHRRFLSYSLPPCRKKLSPHGKNPPACKYFPPDCIAPGCHPPLKYVLP